MSESTVDRNWLLTWTTYGSWLPGDARGSVTAVRDRSGPRIRHNVPGTEFDGPMPGLERSARQRMKGDPIRLVREQADALLSQFQETGGIRGWTLWAAAIMANHVHVVLGVCGDPDSEVLLRDLKAYGSRRLNRCWNKPVSGTWWARSGSKRRLKTESSLLAAVRYVLDQEYPLVLFVHPRIQRELSSGERDCSAERNREVLKRPRSQGQRSGDEC